MVGHYIWLLLKWGFFCCVVEMNIHIGINSKLVKGFSYSNENGILNLDDDSSGFKIVELSTRDSRVINLHGINMKIISNILDTISTTSTDIKFSVHAPYVSPSSTINLNLADYNERNFFIMRNVFEVAEKLNAKSVVIHPGVYEGSSNLKNSIKSIKILSKIADNYGITLLLENLHPFKVYQRIGTTPEEIFEIYHKVNEENLKIAFDIGHAFLSSVYYKFSIKKWFDLLSPHIQHIHIHDNFGNSDDHLPLGKGNMPIFDIFSEIKKTNAENIILELKTKSKDLVAESINFLRKGLNL